MRDIDATRVAQVPREHELELDAWAERVASALPPLTQAEAATIGRLAAVLDARAENSPAQSDNPPRRVAA